MDLPPPPPPQQAEVAPLKERHEDTPSDQVITLEAGEYRLRISGNTHLPESRIREVTGVGKNASQKILLLNALYKAEGYPLVRVRYAREGNDVYVRVNQGRLAELKAPPKIEPFFDQFVGRSGLRQSDLEPMLVLAGLKADRAGYDLTTKYEVSETDPGAFTLLIDGERQSDHETWNLTGVLGNPGNRFLGRYFGIGNARYHAPNGDLWSLGYTAAVTEVGPGSEDESLDRIDTSFTRVTSYGLYSLNASYTDYTATDFTASAPGTRLQFQADRAEAEITQAGLSGNQILYALEDTRWLLEESVEYVDSVIDVEEPAELRIQDEAYFAARIGTTGSLSWKWLGREGSLQAGAGYKRGIGDDDGTLDRDADSTLRRTAEFEYLDAKIDVGHKLPYGLLASLNLKGQRAFDHQVPQQQQWVLGGADNLSAFLPGVLVGDTGAYGRLSLQLPRWELGDLAYRVSLFYEAGSARFEDDGFGETGDTRTATDGGLKLELAYGRHWQLTAHLAEPLSTSGLSEDFQARNETDVFFNLRAEY